MSGLKCNHTECKTKFCPHCGELINESDIDELISYIQSRIDAAGKRYNTLTELREEQTTVEKIPEIEPKNKYSSVEEYRLSMDKELTPQIDQAHALRARWQRRLEAVEKLLEGQS